MTPRINVSEEHAASIIRVEKVTWVFTKHATPRRYLSTKPHGVTFQSTVVFHSHRRENLTYQVPSADKTMISDGNAINAHALDFVADDELLLPVLKAFVPSHDRYKVREVSYVSV